jgi:hypothetical protein
MGVVDSEPCNHNIDPRVWCMKTGLLHEFLESNQILASGLDREGIIKTNAKILFHEWETIQRIQYCFISGGVTCDVIFKPRRWNPINGVSENS